MAERMKMRGFLDSCREDERLEAIRVTIIFRLYLQKTMRFGNAIFFKQNVTWLPCVLPCGLPFVAM